MNLEDVEQKCLGYLMQSKNPVVPVDTLLRYLHRSEEHHSVTEKDLLEFLRPHELFRVIEPIPLGDDAEASELAKAGLAMRPSVLLFSRVPTAQQMKESMLESIDRMTGALQTALEEARAARDRDKARQIRRILERASTLRTHVETML